MEVRAEEVDRRKKRSGVRTEPWGPQVLGEEGGGELGGGQAVPQGWQSGPVFLGLSPSCHLLQNLELVINPSQPQLPHL